MFWCPLNRGKITNLILNAVEALHDLDGDKSLWVISRKKSTEIEIQFIDNGPEIPLDVQEQLFTPFYTTKEDGLGMGLVIVKSIINDMGGVIAYDPKIHYQNGKGGFVIKLPVSTSE